MKALWKLKIIKYFENQDWERESVRDLSIYPVDKETCIVYNSELDSWSIFEGKAHQIVMTLITIDDEEMDWVSDFIKSDLGENK